jgi:transcription initiation factor TFIID TATA-box-binding protein
MKTKAEESLKIENIVASAKVSDHLDLPNLASRIKDAEYNKKRFPGVVLRMQEPKIAALVFGSGKVVLTGAKSIESLNQGLEILWGSISSGSNTNPSSSPDWSTAWKTPR